MDAGYGKGQKITEDMGGFMTRDYSKMFLLIGSFMNVYMELFQMVLSFIIYVVVAIALIHTISEL